jgi:hypothetical protein
LLDDHLQRCSHPSLPHKLEPSTTYKAPVSAALSFPYSTRTRPTSPAALNSVTSDVLSFSVFRAKHRGSQRTTSGSFRSALCFLRLNTPRFGDLPPKFPRGCPSAFLSVLSISFLLTNPANPSLRRGHRQSLHWFGRNGLTSISKEVKIQASRWYLHVGSRHWRILGFGLRPRTATRPPTISTIPYRLMYPCFIPRSIWRKGFHHQNPS